MEPVTRKWDRPPHLSNEASNQLTKQRLQSALIELMSEKSFDEISISELVRRSGVSRPSFYRNYRTKKELLNEMVSDVICWFEESMFDPQYASAPKNWYLELFRSIRHFRVKLGLSFRMELPAELDFGWEPRKPDSDNEQAVAGYYRICAQMAGLKHMVRLWCDSGMKESSEYMATLCDQEFGDCFHQYAKAFGNRKG